MARRDDVTLTWHVGKRGIHNQCAYADVGWRRYHSTGDGVITAVQKDE